jgi:Uma2 family endonuclease
VSQAHAFTSFEEYLAGEVAGGVRHEWIAGQVYAMAGGTERHDATVEAVRDILGPGARAKGCRRFTGNRSIRIGDVAYYPDFFVVCGKAAHELYETDASLLVEVRSPSTADIDRREKALAYARLPSACTYLLVDPLYRQIELGEREDIGWAWATCGPGDAIYTPYGLIVVDELYDEIDAATTTP